jgi:hypothetical protein
MATTKASPTVTIFGEKFKVRAGLNAWMVSRAVEDVNDIGAFSRLILHSIEEADHKRLDEVMSRQAAITFEDLNNIQVQIWEVASGGRPTTPSSASRRTTNKKAASTRSAAR